MSKEENMLIYGRHPVMDVLRSERSIEKVLIQTDTNPDLKIEIHELSKTKHFQIQYVPKVKMDKLSDKNHQGIAAFIAPVTYHDGEELVDAILSSSEHPLILILDSISDVRNLGAIARSAECSGAAGIIIQQKGSAPVNADAIKTSAGALTKIKIGRANSLAYLIAHLQNTGWQVLGSDLKAEKQLMDVDFKEPTAVVIGSEGRGVSNYILKSVDETFIIPQVGTTDSLNVSVATGIILYEALRQKMAS